MDKAEKKKEKANTDDKYKYFRELTDEEKKGVDEMRKRLAESDYGAKYKGNDVGELIRFLKARNFNVDKSFPMYTTHLNWRETYKPSEIDEDDITNEIKKGKLRILPCDKKGRPTVVLRTKLHVAGEMPLEETIKYTVWSLERLNTLLPEGVEQGIVLYDRTGFESRNFDQKFLAEASRVLEANYPERVHKVFILHTNWLFNMFFKIVLTFLPTSTAEKIVILNDDAKIKEALLDLYEPDNLWENFGGNYVLPDDPLEDLQRVRDFLKPKEESGGKNKKNEKEGKEKSKRRSLKVEAPDDEGDNKGNKTERGEKEETKEKSRKKSFRNEAPSDTKEEEAEGKGEKQKKPKKEAQGDKTTTTTTTTTTEEPSKDRSKRKSYKSEPPVDEKDN